MLGFFFFQVFHVCDSGRKVSFLCPNGTIFRQSHLICDWWFRVECERSPELYDQSVQQLEADQHVYKQRAQTISNAMQNALAEGVKDTMLLESPVSVTNKVTDKFNSESNLPSVKLNSAIKPSTTPQNFRATMNDFNQNDISQLNSDFSKSISSQPSTTANFDFTYFNSVPSSNINVNSQVFATPPTITQYNSPITSTKANFTQFTTSYNNFSSIPSQDQRDFNEADQNQSNFDSNSLQQIKPDIGFSREKMITDFNSFNSNPVQSSGFNFNSNVGNTLSPPLGSSDQNFSVTPIINNAFLKVNSPSSSQVKYSKSLNDQQKQTPNVKFLSPSSSQTNYIHNPNILMKPIHSANFNTPPLFNYNSNLDVKSTLNTNMNTPPYNQNQNFKSNAEQSINYTQPSSLPRVINDQNINFQNKPLHSSNFNGPPPSRVNHSQNSNLHLNLLQNTYTYTPSSLTTYDQNLNFQEISSPTRMNFSFNGDLNHNPLSSNFGSQKNFNSSFSENRFKGPPQQDFQYNFNHPNRINSVTSPQNSFTSEQKTTPPKFSVTSPIRNNAGLNRITNNYNPNFTFSSTSPRSTVSVTIPPRISHSTFSNLASSRTQLQTSFSSTAVPLSRPVTNTPFTAGLDSQNSGVSSIVNGQTTRFQQTQQFPSLTTPSIVDLDNNSYLREQQVLAETAAFAENGKYPQIQNLYYNQNFLGPFDSKSKNNDITWRPSGGMNIPKTNQFNSVPNFNPQNYTNKTYPYFQTADNNVNLLNLITSTTKRGITNPTKTKVSKPAVSEFILNSMATDSQSNDGTTQEPISQTIPVLLTNQTIEGYVQLFPKHQENSTTKTSDLNTEFSNGLVQSSSPKTLLPSADSWNEKLKLKSSPDFREIAQIFSRALSAYLEDPEQFRKILSEVRPTEPPAFNGPKNEVAEEEILSFSENESTTQKSTTLTSDDSPQVIRDPETFAEEINNFMFDPLTGHTDSGEFNVNETYYPPTIFNNGTTAVSFTISPLLDFTLTSTLSSALPAIITDRGKANLYEDKENKFYDMNAQSIQDEPLLITADTQSFVAPDNLVRYQNYNKYNVPPPSLKMPVYPQFGMRTTGSSPYISSRADVETTQRVYSQTVPAATTHNVLKANDDWPQTTLNRLSTNMLSPLLNESAAQAVMNMMEAAQTNTALRNKLVLLLVNDRSQSENKSMKDMKLKLLKALLVPSTSTLSSTTFSSTSFTYPVSRRKVRKEGRVIVSRQVNPVTPTYQMINHSKSNKNTISRNSRSTMKPSDQPGETDGLHDTDTRAVDLLKTLYSLASSWNR